MVALTDTIDNFNILLANSRAAASPSPHLVIIFEVAAKSYRQRQGFTSKQLEAPLSTLSFVFVVACSCQIVGHHRQRQGFKPKGGCISLTPPRPSSLWWHVSAESSDTIDNIKDSPANPSLRAGVFPSLHLVLRLRYLPNLRTPSTTPRFHQQTARGLSTSSFVAESSDTIDNIQQTA